MVASLVKSAHLLFACRSHPAIGQRGHTGYRQDARICRFKQCMQHEPSAQLVFALLIEMMQLFNPSEQLQGERVKRLGSNLVPNFCFLGWRDVWLHRLSIPFEFSFVCI